MNLKTVCCILLFPFVRSLDGLKFTTADKKRKNRIPVAVLDKNNTDCTEPVPKRQCLDKKEHMPVPTSDEQKVILAAKRSQIVVGVNQVTKSLEKGILRAVVVCLSAKPALLHEHIQVLSATRGVHSIAVHGMSDAIAPVLGLKSALAIGLKVRPPIKTSPQSLDSFLLA